MILSSLPKLNAAITPVPVIPFACMSDFLMTFPLTGSIKSPSSTIKLSLRIFILQNISSSLISQITPGEASRPFSIFCPSIAGPAAADAV